jgi:hypothetical protein
VEPQPPGLWVLGRWVLCQSVPPPPTPISLSQRSLQSEMNFLLAFAPIEGNSRNSESSFASSNCSLTFTAPCVEVECYTLCKNCRDNPNIAPIQLLQLNIVRVVLAPDLQVRSDRHRQFCRNDNQTRTLSPIQSPDLQLANVCPRLCNGCTKRCPSKSARTTIVQC